VGQPTGTRGPQLTHDSGPAKLLVKAALEAVLAKSASRLDVAARSERLKAAALMECADKGYAALTIAHIAKRAKVSTATIYAEYPDRDALLVAAMEMLFTILASDVIEMPRADDPQERVEQLLIAHGQVYAEPLAVWFFRLHVMLAWSGHAHLRDMGHFIFRGIDGFWQNFLTDLESEGHLVGIDADLLVPLLLGPVERCTIIARLGCGDEQYGRPDLGAVARNAAQILFAVWGKKSQRPARTDEAPLPLMPMDGPVAALAPSQSADLPNQSEDHDASRATTPKAQRERIMRAAIALCQERGYSAASMQDIAALSGASTATIYRHYVDKADVFSTALESEFALRGPFPDPAGLTLSEGLMAIGARASDPDWQWMHNVVMASEISGSPRVVAIARSHRKVIEDYVDALLSGMSDADLYSGSTRALMINFLLGAIERSGLLALILFGKDAVDTALLAKLAAFTSEVHEQLAKGAASPLQPG
jgi:AcrR family transcriptional regulator